MTEFTFSDVDASGRVAALEQQLRTQAEQFAADRRRRLQLLRLGEGKSALDIGCGLGEITVMLAELVGATGSVVGIDSSDSMVARAQQTAAPVDNVTIKLGNGTALDFADGTFDAVHSERVFMHLDEPDVALAEAVRVTKPGRRVMVVDPDHSMTRIDSEDQQTAAAVFWTMAAAKMKNPRSGSRLIGQFRRAGIDDIDVVGTISVLRDPLGDRASFAQALSDAADQAVAERVVVRDAADDFLRDLRARLDSGTYVMLMPMITVVGTKPL